MSKSNDKKKLESSFDYLPPPLEMRHDLSLMAEESASDKFWRKFTSQPLVPVGCGFTALALSYGMYQMKTGNRFLSQRMMRLRILAQGFTVVACLFGVLHTAKTSRITNKPSE